MELVSFSRDFATRVGVLVGGEIIDLSVAEAELPREMCALLAAGSEALGVAARASGPRYPIQEVKLEAPILRPPKILAVGFNYADHAAETGQETPQHPVIFNKQSTAVIGPGDAIHRPRVSELVDYEGELAVVIGKRCRHVPKQRAREVVAGYTIANDVSVRDWQIRVPTMTMGKSFDTHCPLGPAIVTADEFGEPTGHDIRTFVNGELRQDSNTRELIFDCFDLIEHLSTVFTLEPGDVISTGTPAGVALGMKPPQWLKAGDVVRIEIEGIGVLENPVIEEPESTTRF
jgi:2-keto-4-pentenoate hydratase/2-oxohepta-3-ene-1,7-dioic acid hydratase in catechol pathway